MSELARVASKKRLRHCFEVGCDGQPTSDGRCVRHVKPSVPPLTHIGSRPVADFCRIRECGRLLRDPEFAEKHAPGLCEKHGQRAEALKLPIRSSDQTLQALLGPRSPTKRQCPAYVHAGGRCEREQHPKEEMHFWEDSGGRLIVWTKDHQHNDQPDAVMKKNREEFEARQAGKAESGSGFFDTKDDYGDCDKPCVVPECTRNRGYGCRGLCAPHSMAARRKLSISKREGALWTARQLRAVAEVDTKQFGRVPEVERPKKARHAHVTRSDAACLVPSCSRRSVARKLCGSHGAKARRLKLPAVLTSAHLAQLAKDGRAA